MKMGTNRELVKMFRDMALMYELEEVQWKPRAYREAAYGIEGLSRDVKDIFKKDGREGLKEIPGVGDSIAYHIIEYIKKGNIKKFNELRKKYPKEITELVDLEGMGPKKVKVLIKKLKISSPEKLKKAAKEHRIRKLKGFGEKTEQNILDALKIKKESKKRMRVDKALEIAEEIVEYMKKKAPLQEIDYVGSLRRMRTTIGDIDILVISKSPKKVIDAFTKMDSVRKVISKGTTRSSVILKEDDFHADLRVVDKSSYAGAMQYFTGSKEHSIELRKIAIKKGYKLSEYGIFKRKKGKKNKKIPLKSEKALYEKLGLQYIPPEMRENRGELQAAKKKQIPDLVELKDIKGDFHIHTKYSDGSNTIEEMVKAAKKKGYAYIAIADHSKSTRIAKGMDEKKLKRQIAAINKLAKKEKIKILKSAEVDILKDGSLDYPDSILKKLDIVIGGVHSNFKMSSRKMTERIIKALKNKHLTILAHPTGRSIGKRDRYDADFEKIFKAAAKNKKILEINSQPERLDLDGANILAAKKLGCKFCINTDSKDTSDLDLMKLGVGQARRGWLEKKDVINTRTCAQLKKIFKL
ncbi:DNA polymerase/3'-5' exonuclease PolX [Candidatus Woesearchaeota archaeon]|nr:DNA polymerase/3'-5' exonuclease PolX [Candidatus Woesearchaeota archaeon]